MQKVCEKTLAGDGWSLIDEKNKPLFFFLKLKSICTESRPTINAQRSCWPNFFTSLNMAKPVYTTKSSTIHKVEYLEKEKTLEIEFRTGNIYKYYDVPPRLWKVFQLYIEVEGSAGSFFNEYIKNQFTSEKIKEG